MRKIKFKLTCNDLNNATVWDLYLNDRKIGWIRRELFYREKGVMNGGYFHFEVLHRNYKLPLRAKSMLIKVINGAIDSLEADLIIDKINRSEWKESRWITLEKAKHAQT